MAERPRCTARLVNPDQREIRTLRTDFEAYKAAATTLRAALEDVVNASESLIRAEGSHFIVTPRLYRVARSGQILDQHPLS